MSNWRGSRLPLPLLLAAAASLTTAAGGSGCNVVKLKRERIRGTLEDAGLRQQEAHLGEDTVAYWDGGGAGTDKADAHNAVVLLHGFGLEALWQWSEQVPVLARTRRVVIPDLLWFGRSQSTRRDFSLAHQISAVAALIDHLGLRQANLVGMSYGGLVAYGLAAAPGAQFNTVTIVDSPGPAFTSADHAKMLQRLGVNDLAELLIPETPAALRKLMALAYSSPPRLPDFVLRQVIAESYTTNRAELQPTLRAPLEHLQELTSAAPRMLRPLCLIWGSDDPIFPIALMDRLQAFADGPTRRHIVNGARHAPNVEYPEQFNAFLGDCLNMNGAPPSQSR